MSRARDRKAARRAAHAARTDRRHSDGVTANQRRNAARDARRAARAPALSEEDC